MNKSYKHQVQYYETDQMGIVHHSNYIRWFEEARSFVLEDKGFGYKSMEELGVISPVLSVNAQFKTMTHYYDIVEIETSILSYNGIKLCLKYVVKDEKTKEVRCEGESSHCFLDKSGKPISLKREYPDLHNFMLSMMDDNND